MASSSTPSSALTIDTYNHLKHVTDGVRSCRNAAAKTLEAFVNSGNTNKTAGGVRAVVIDPSLYKIIKYGGIGGDLFKKGGGGGSGEFEVTVLSENCQYNANATAVYYLVRPSADTLKLLGEHIAAYAERAPAAKIRIGFCPKTIMPEYVLMTEYKLEELTSVVGVEQVNLGLIPLEEDVLSMEMAGDFRELYLNNDVTVLHSVAQSVVELQMAHGFGPIRTIKAKGKYAKKVLTILNRLEHEVGHDKLLEQPSKIDEMIIIDRSADFITPFMTQLTYEGLIEELIGIEAAVAKPAFQVITDEAAVQFRHPDGIVPLHGNDSIFSDLRDLNFSAVGGVLRSRSLEVKASYEQRKTATDLKDIKEFMSKLPATQIRHRQIGIHTNIATEIGKTTQNPTFRERILTEQLIIRQEEERRVIEFIEDMINKGEDVREVLRLMCLFSIVNGGIKPRLYDQLKETLLLSYGIPLMIAVLNSLEQCGLLLKNDGRTGVFANMRKANRLWVEGLNELRPNDAGYAYSGYCPLLTRAVEALMRDGNINTNVAAAAQGGGGLAGGVGGMFDLGATIGAGLGSAVGVVGGGGAAAAAGAGGAAATEDYDVLTKDVQGSSHKTIVFIVGGVTHAELSTLRYAASNDKGCARNFIFATTSITSGVKLLDNLLPFLPKKSAAK